MSESAKNIDLGAWRERAPLDWSTLAMLNSSTCKRDAASTYTKLGLHPIALHGLEENGACTCRRPDCGKSTGKHPVHNGWQTAALVVAKLDAQLQRNWRWNIGLRMGMQPGGFRLVTIDVDGSRDLLAPLEAQYGELPPTLTATSGKGFHLIFKLKDDAPLPKNLVKLAPGVDVRSEGGQIVAAPSNHVSGRRYRWLDAREPAGLP